MELTGVHRAEERTQGNKIFGDDALFRRIRYKPIDQLYRKCDYIEMLDKEWLM
jgi:hypothetical protein